MAHIIKSLKEYEEKYKKYIDDISIDDLRDDTGLYTYNTSLKYPLSCSGIGNCYLHINREFYETNKEKVQEFILDTIRTTEQYGFALRNEDFLNKSFVDAIVSNKNIKSIAVLENIFVSKEIIQSLLSSHISHLSCDVDFAKDEELLYQYIPGLEITNYPTVAGVSVMDFGRENVELYIAKHLTEKELTKLKILFMLYPQEKIYIKFRYKEQMDEIIRFINSDKIIIRNSVPYTKEEYVYLNKTYDNVYFDVASTYITTTESLILREEIIESIINELVNLDLSPLEKYMYLYNTVKMYKEYKEIEDETALHLSRYSEYTLFNDYMVCVGYATLLEELVDRLNDNNILCSTYGCSILDDDENVGHCRCIVKIKDEKYGVNGIYISDPTWDSVRYYKKDKKKNGKTKINYKIPTADIDLYNHFLLTKEEEMDETICYSSTDASDVLFGTGKSNKSNYASVYLDIHKINEKFNTNFIINKTNHRGEEKAFVSKSIPRETLIQAITNLYFKIYCGKISDIRGLVQNTIAHNITEQNKHFDITKDKFGVIVKTKRKQKVDWRGFNEKKQ